MCIFVYSRGLQVATNDATTLESHMPLLRPCDRRRDGLGRIPLRLRRRLWAQKPPTERDLRDRCGRAGEGETMTGKGLKTRTVQCAPSMIFLSVGKS